MTIDWTDFSPDTAAASGLAQGVGAGFDTMFGTCMQAMDEAIADFLDTTLLPPGATIEFELAIRQREDQAG